jgi:predicted Zn-dependent protease
LPGRRGSARFLLGSWPAATPPRYLTGSATRRKTACHELGHALGLGHRRTGRTCMRDGFATMYGRPDATDYANLRALYRRP